MTRRFSGWSECFGVAAILCASCSSTHLRAPDAGTEDSGSRPPPSTDGAAAFDGDPDADGDGVVASVDCDDADPRIGTTARRSCASGCAAPETCVDGVWQGCADVRQLDPGGIFAELAPVRTNTAGQTLLAYTSNVGGRTSVFTHSFDDGAGWSAAQRIPGSDGAERVVVDLAEDGRRVAAWNAHDGSSLSELWAVVAAPGADWDPAERVTANGVWQDVAIGPDGSSMVAYHHEGGVFAKTHDTTTGWGSNDYLDYRPRLAGFVRLASSSVGVFALWNEREPAPGLLGRLYLPGGGRDALTRIGEASAEAASRPVGRPAITSDGDIFVAWTSDAGVHANHYLASTGEWTGEAIVEPSPDGDASHLQLVTLAGGGALVVWTDFGGMSPGLWSSRHSPGGGWSAPERVSDDLGELRSRLISTAGGDVLVVWSAGWDRPMGLRRYTPGEGFGPRHTLPSGDDPTVFEAPSGTVHVVYEVMDSRMVSNICALALPIRSE